MCDTLGGKVEVNEHCPVPAYHATEESKRQKALAAVQIKGSALEYVAKELKQDKEVVLAAVRQNGLALEHAADELKIDKEVVLAAVQNPWLGLEVCDKGAEGGQGHSAGSCAKERRRARTCCKGVEAGQRKWFSQQSNRAVAPWSMLPTS